MIPIGDWAQADLHVANLPEFGAVRSNCPGGLQVSVSGEGGRDTSPVVAPGSSWSSRAYRFGKGRPYLLKSVCFGEAGELLEEWTARRSAPVSYFSLDSTLGWPGLFVQACPSEATEGTSPKNLICINDL
ncbi:hypothetical protein GCM10017782_09800 [Deinococcus ficus]|nr:hypothetical protein GCM10017782_09800 [Deinococcus ficus]